ncbi:hypothetical protein ANN_03453 [Periplaneta americana]|uniref:RING-type domain-containing protein n=1 Tax=Periplaneta americana TaxID=6978 RepID=A0ABQ8U396_PERAM|nr:hypothetical protein ANN_03453 [Periplaneta americana]
MSELECPVCFNYMHPPIKTCQNGHCICNNCKRNVIVCPVCRGKFLSVRNVVFENIANHFLSFDRPTAPFFCPLHDVNRFRCRWEGSLPELRDHIRETHLREYIECGDGNVDINISAGKVTLHSTVMLTMGEMFYIHISLSMNKLHGYVQHIGDDNSPEYKYRLCIVKPGCEDEINVTFSRLNDNEGDNAGEMSPGSSTESYPAFARIGLRENPGKNLNQETCPDRDSNPGHLVSQPDELTVTPQVWTS